MSYDSRTNHSGSNFKWANNEVSYTEELLLLAQPVVVTIHNAHITLAKSTVGKCNDLLATIL